MEKDKNIHGVNEKIDKRIAEKMIERILRLELKILRGNPNSKKIFKKNIPNEIKKIIIDEINRNI